MGNKFSRSDPFPMGIENPVTMTGAKIRKKVPIVQNEEKKPKTPIQTKGSAKTRQKQTKAARTASLANLAKARAARAT